MEEQVHEVTIYTTPTCPWCQVAKRYLASRNIPYTEVNVAADPAAALEMIQKSGQQGVPVLDIDGEIVIGFDRARIDQLLGLS